MTEWFYAGVIALVAICVIWIICQIVGNWLSRGFQVERPEWQCPECLNTDESRMLQDRKTGQVGCRKCGCKHVEALELLDEDAEYDHWTPLLTDHPEEWSYQEEQE